LKKEKTNREVSSNPGKREQKEWSIYTYQDEGDKCHGGIYDHIISKYIP